MPFTQQVFNFFFPRLIITTRKKHDHIRYNRPVGVDQVARGIMKEQPNKNY